LTANTRGPPANRRSTLSRQQDPYVTVHSGSQPRHAENPDTSLSAARLMLRLCPPHNAHVCGASAPAQPPQGDWRQFLSLVWPFWPAGAHLHSTRRCAVVRVLSGPRGGWEEEQGGNCLAPSGLAQVVVRGQVRGNHSANLYCAIPSATTDFLRHIWPHCRQACTRHHKTRKCEASIFSCSYIS